jgi:pilus assembly protein CpaE
VRDVIKALVALDRGVEADQIRASLPTDGEIEFVGLVDGLDEGWQTLQEVSVDLLVIACAAASDRALFLIEGAIKQRPDRPVVVLAPPSANGFMRRVFEAGADDILTLPQTPEEIRFALNKAVVRKQGSAAGAAGATGSLVCVLGPKGGTGKTLTSCNLAVSLASAGNSVVLVDLDLQFGDVGLALGLSPEKTIYDLAKSGGSIDAEKIEAFLVPHPSGIRVLMAPVRPDHASVVTAEFLRDLYAALQSTNDFIVVDTPPGFTPEVIATIDSSTEVLIVATLDALSLKNTKLGLETLALMGYERERIRFLLNRADSRVGIGEDEVLSIVGMQPEVKVPSDRDVAVAVNEGTPIVLANERSDAARAFQTLASLYEKAEVEAVSNGHGRRGLFRFRRKAS